MFSTDQMIIEAPNWTLDGRWLILNGDESCGAWRATAAPDWSRSSYPAYPRSTMISARSDGTSRVRVGERLAHLRGRPDRRPGAPRHNDHEWPFMHYLHGVSPDGETLAYIGLEPEGDHWWARANIFVVPVAGGRDRRLTDEFKVFDGCEYSPDGEWIYCNTELFSDADGHAQIARLRPDGTNCSS